MKRSYLAVTLLWLAANVLVQAATLEFPDLDLSSSADEIRTWARQHEYSQGNPSEPGQETYKRSFSNGRSETISFVAGGRGLNMLRFEQYGVLESAPLLRSKVYKLYGKPVKDQILQGGTLRLTYPYDYREPARRVFLLQSHYVSMLFMTEAFVADQNRTPARAEPAKQETKKTAAQHALDTWFVPVLWIGGALLGLVVFINVMPRAVTDPVTKFLRSTLGSLFELTEDVVAFVVYFITMFSLYAMALLSALAVGSGALELGTSWWWGVPLLFGIVMTHKADQENFLKRAFVAIAFYAIALFGVFFQKQFFGG